MDKTIKILGFAGSLRKGSYNRSLLRVSQELLPSNAEIEIFDLNGMPLFNADQENNPPEIIREFKAKIKAADAVLMVTPEYNYSIPGVLKNAIDWASRPSGDSVWPNKVAAIMSVSNGMLGGSRCQYHLRQTFLSIGVKAVVKPEIFVTFCEKKFDETGALTDEPTRIAVTKLLQALVDLAAKG